jgi:prevent-host-death family protein
MKNANVSDLKAHLSEYLAQVRQGEIVTVYDRRTPIARMVPLDSPGDDFEVTEPEAAGAELRGLPRVRLHHAVDLGALLRQDRNQR